MKGLLGSLLIGCISGFGATINVTSTNDNGTGSLREVISSASPGDTVQFLVTGKITLTNGELLISKNLTITGPGATNLLICGNGESRIFHIATNVVAIISELSVTNGLSPAGTSNSVTGVWAGTGELGGGILNEGTLTLQKCTVINNKTGKGGDDSQQVNSSVSIGGSGKGGNGGGVGNTGTLYMSDCLVTGNQTGTGGNEAYSDLSSFEYSSIGYGGDGGGVYNSGMMVISNSTVINNVCGSGVYTFSAGGNGGGFYNQGTALIYNCLFNSNSSGAAGTVFADVTFVAGKKGGDAGGIYNAGVLCLDSSTLCNNLCGNGGDGADGGSGINMNFVTSGGIGGSGAGLFNSGTLSMTNCTLVKNICGKGGKGGSGTYGGASAGNGGDGGGLCNSGTYTLVNCTVTGNTTGEKGTPGFSAATGYVDGTNGMGGGINTKSNSLVLNTLIAGNSDGNNGFSSDIYGAFTSLGHNLVGIQTTNGFTASGDITGTTISPLNAQVASLSDNGGLSPTCALFSGSPAIDAGDDTVLSSPWSLSTDQLGQARKSGSHVDIGACEFDFNNPQYSITLVTNGHGTVTLTPILPSYTNNSVVTVVATASDNALFSQWSGSITNSASTNTLVVTSNLVLQANFLDMVTLTTVAPGGAIETGESSNRFVQNSTVTLTAVPSNGWQFVCWTGDLSGTNATAQLQMTSDKSVHAIFATPLKISIVGNGTVHASPVLDLYPYGMTVRLYPVPAQGSKFINWTTDLTLAGEFPATLPIIKGNPSVTANFQEMATGTVRTVTSTSDSGDGSLRQALANAQENDTILFSVAGVISLNNQEIAINKSLTITGPGSSSLVINGNASTRVLSISSNVSVTITGITFTNGSGGNPGGGIFNAGTLHLKDCVICGNKAASGDWVYSSGDGPGANGGGIGNNGFLDMDACLISENHAGHGGPGADGEAPGGLGGSGGGIYNNGVFFMTNSTISGNTTGNGGNASGYYNALPGGNAGCGAGVYSSGILTIVNCTITGNTTGIGGTGGYSKWTGKFGSSGAAGVGGGVFVTTNSTVLLNTLIAGNTVPPNSSGTDIAGVFASQGHNLVGIVDTNASIISQYGDLFGTVQQPINAMVSALSNNGGNSLTCNLLPGSPAIDAGDDSVLSTPLPLTVDQRGFTRPAGKHVDIGAFEFLETRDIHLNLNAVLLPAERQIKVELTGNVGRSFDLFISTNLVDWSRVSTLTNTTEKSTWTQSLTPGCQFYRAQQLP